MTPDARQGRAAVHRRLRPLYAATFLQGFVLWYAVEKVFMRGIGFDAATTGLAVAVFSTATLLVETPSGMLADRWSRKGVLMLAGGVSVLASVSGGASGSVPAYLVSTALAGVFLALCSGTSDAIAYETWAEAGAAGGAEPFLGMLRLVEGAALVASAIIGSALADATGLRSTYLVTVVPALASVVVLVRVREPRRAPRAAGGRAPLRGFGTAVRRLLLDPSTAPVTAVLVLLSVLTYGYFDMAPLWLMALALPTPWFGAAAAAVLLGYAVGGYLGGALGLHRPGRLLAGSAVMVAASVALTVAAPAPVFVAAGVVLVVVLTALTVVFTRLLHESLTADVRAAAASMVSSTGRAVLIPFVLVFGLVARESSVFTAAWLVVALAVVAAGLVLRHGRRAAGGRVPDGVPADGGPPALRVVPGQRTAAVEEGTEA